MKSENKGVNRKNMTYDFNMDYDLDIKPIAKSESHFNK